jgi:(2Fe-2S) ferredoxin
VLVDFLESLIETGKIVTQDLIDYFEEEMVEAAKAGESQNETKFSAQRSLGSVTQPTVSLSTPKIVYDPLDAADTRSIVKFLLESGVRVDSPVNIKFVGNKAIVSIVSLMYTSQVAVVTRTGDRLDYKTVNCNSPFATVE